MKRDYYEILGVAKNATEDDIKKAYRKLSSKHHPDKHSKATVETQKKHEADFKEAKEAYEMLTDPAKRAEYDQHGHNAPQRGNGADFRQFNDINDILHQMRAAQRAHQVFEFVTDIPIAEAYKGFKMKVRIGDVMDEVEIPPGLPNMARGQYTSVGGKRVFITTRFTPSPFRVRNVNEIQQIISEDGSRFTGMLNSGDVEIDLEIDALDLLLGTWTSVTDILGEKLQVRVPSGFNQSQRLKVKGKGYLNWSVKEDKAGPRADMFIRVVPKFKPISQLDHEKVKQLFEQTKPKEPTEVANGN